MGITRTKSKLHISFGFCETKVYRERERDSHDGHCQLKGKVLNLLSSAATDTCVRYMHSCHCQTPVGETEAKKKMHYFSKLKLKEQKVLRHVMTYTDSSSVSTCRNNKLLGFQMNKFCKNKIKNINMQKLHNLYVL